MVELHGKLKKLFSTVFYKEGRIPDEMAPSKQDVKTRIQELDHAWA
jgi:hypothetical protein